MVEEINADIANGRLYMSSRLSDQGIEEFPNLLITAAQSHDESWLTQQLRGKFKTMETRSVKGKTIEAKVPETAPETLAEGEFNRFYMRALCRRAIEENVANLIAYRAKDVTNARSESERIINQLFSPESLLNDLRGNPGTDTALGLPPGPNSGISVKIVAA